jgi:hypothetical protein
MTRTGWFRYVTYSQIDAYHKAGWMIVADLGLPHSNYALLMWACDCPHVAKDNTT